MTTEKPESGTNCRECGASLTGRYCTDCGQDGSWAPGPLREALSDLREDFLAFDVRFLRTLHVLVLRPGFLSAEFLAGRRKRFTSPLRLYLFLAVLAAFATGGFSPAGEPGPVAEALSGTHFLYAVIAIVQDDPSVTEETQAAYDLAGDLGHWVGLLLFAPLLALAASRAIREPPRYYVEHLIAAFHFQSFVLLVIALEGFLLRAFPGSAVGSAVYAGGTGIVVVVYYLAVLRWFYRRNLLGAVGRGLEVALYFSVALAAVAMGLMGVVLGVQALLPG